MSSSKRESVFIRKIRNWRGNNEIVGYTLRLKGYTYNEKNVHGFACGMINKNDQTKLVSYLNDVLSWNKLGRPINAEIIEKNEKMKVSFYKMYEWLVGLGLLEADSEGTVEEAIQAYVDQEQKVASTIKAVREVWAEVSCIVPLSTKLRDVTEKKLRQVHKALHTGKCSNHKRTGEKHSDCNMMKRWSCITRVFDAAKREGLITIDPCERIAGKKYAKGCTRRKKTYQSVEDFEEMYNLYERMPDIQMFLVQMYTIGSRPGEAWYYDSWEDIEWIEDRPVYINRHYCKTARDVDEGQGHRLGQVRVAIPKRMQDELIKYRDALLMWEVDYPHLFTHRNADCKPPVWNEAKKSFTGRIYCVRKFKYAYMQEAKLKKFDHKLPKALPTTLRASCSSHIYDIGGSRYENHYLQHNEKARESHYCSPLSGRPEMYVVPEGNFYSLYNELFVIGTEGFYNKFNTQDEVLVQVKEDQAMNV